ncbi:CRISPR-associated endonuclease Cas2 [Oscillatoria sp. FACHB-1406]|nr:CRISPR-associated endonuclease Cas2 [Oscillatoria sp. FACHB-1406]MBD2576991.1 CRISPR-associated endonuclease Cas2 [Oscillatoria sp. FACHB-1406]
MLFYLIAYDIPCDKRRKKIADLLEGYGTRVQYSVFECILERAQYQELQKRLKKRYKSAEDSLRFYPLSQHTLSQVEVWGEPPLTRDSSSTVV